MRKVTRAKGNIKGRQAIIEAVEQRTLLSGATIANGVLTVTGTSQQDVIVINFDSDSIDGGFSVKINGNTTNLSATGVDELLVNGEAGNDSINISTGAQFNTGEQATSVVVNDGDGNDSIELNLPQSVDGTSVTSKITAGNGNDNVFVQAGTSSTVTLGNGNDTVSGSASEDNLVMTVNAGNGNDQIDGQSAGDASLVIHANVGTGHDTFNNNNDPDISVTGQTSDGQSVVSARNSVSFGGHVVVATPTGFVPLANAIVFIDDEGTGILSPGHANATTDAQGNYEFVFTNTGNSLTSPLVVSAPGYTFTPSVRTETVMAGIAVSGDDFTLTPIRTATATNPILFGTVGSYNNQGNTIANAVDGNLSTFFDSPTASGGFVALDYGLPQTIKQISFAPRSTLPGRMVGGLFQGSNSADFSNAITLYTVTTAPAVGKLTTVNISNTQTFRYVRYIGPANSYCNIAEMKFTLATSLTGTVIGTTGSYHSQGNTAAHAFDGDLSTFFDAPDATGDWAGQDLGTAKIITQISYAPRSGWASRMVGGMFQASNSADFSSGVVTLYTVPAAPAAGVLTMVQIVNYSAYRYVRYIGPANGYSNIAEAQFAGTTPVAGAFLQANGTLVVNGTSSADTITLSVQSEESPNPDTVTATVNGSSQTFALAGVLQNVINAGADNDTVTLTGFDEGGDDTGHGFEAITVNGGDGDDTLTNNIQSPEILLIDGGAGNDTIFNGGFGAATIIGGDGNDLLKSSGYPGLVESIYGGSGDDTVIADGDTTLAVYDGGAGSNTLDLSENPTPASWVSDINLNLYVNVHNLILGEETDETVIGTSGNDTITGDAGARNVSIVGGGGDDTVNITGGQTVYVDASADGPSNITVTNSQFVTVIGGSGNDTINVRGNSHAYVDGGPGTDTAYTDLGDTVVNVEILNPDTTAKLTGAIIGTPGSYKNDGNTAAKAFDGNLTTFFDAPDASGDWAGLDLGSAKLVTQISFAPRSGWESRMIGGMFQASNSADFSSGVVTLYTVTAAPPAGSLTTVAINNQSAYRYVRYIGPANGFCNIAEVEFFGNTPVQGASLTNDGTLVVNGSANADNITVDLAGFGAVTVTIDGVVQSFFGGVAALVVNAGAGNDTVLVDGNDVGITDSSIVPVTINGGDGNDNLTTHIFTPAGPPMNQVYIDGGAGNDYLDVQNDGFATLIGGDGKDTFDSNGNPNGLTESVYGGDGNDTLRADGDTAYSIYDGGAGSNTIDYATNAFSTIPGFHTLLMSGGFLSNVNTVIAGNQITNIVANDNGDTISYPDADGSDVSITGGAGNDIITVNDAGIDPAGPVIINGNGGNDTITVTNSQNVSINGGAGNDTIHARGNTSVFIDGGPGTDTAYTDQADTVINVENLNPDLPAVKKLTGKLIGTPGSYKNDGNTSAKAFDGNLTTFFDAPDASGDWVGLDLGSPQVVTQVKYALRAGWESRMVGGEIQASNTADFSSGVVTLFTISSTPTAGVLTTQSLANTTAYRYYRYIGPANGYCDIAELEFDS